MRLINRATLVALVSCFVVRKNGLRLFHLASTCVFIYKIVKPTGTRVTDCAIRNPGVAR